MLAERMRSFKAKSVLFDVSKCDPFIINVMPHYKRVKLGTSHRDAKKGKTSDTECEQMLFELM